MPEEENKKQEEMVDIDTSGPEVEVNVEEKEEIKNETIDNDNKSDDALSKPDEQLDVRVEEDNKEPVEEKKQETKKEELEEYSDGVKKRIAKLTKKWREAERQREAALEYAKGVQEESTKLKTRVSSLEPSYVNAMEGRVVSGLQAAQAKLAAAREAGDIKTEVEAQKDIARLGVEEARVAGMKQRAAAEMKQVKEPVKSLEDSIAPPQAAPDPRAEEWAESNPWFGQDSAMTYTAFDLHEKLTKEEGFDPSSDEYYAEVDKRMRLDFPHKFGKTETREPTKPTQTVASATRSVNNSRKTVRLTPSQVTIAKKLGVPLELYAKQLNITKER
jgi:antitoxin component YwqK of YwqJK toxin-antitoxin module